jgi:N-acetylneuraminate lyase
MNSGKNKARQSQAAALDGAGRGSAAWSGIMPALMTPFGKTGKLNLGVLPSFIEFLLQAGCKGFFVGGSTGEGFLQTVEERERFAHAVMGIVKKRVPVILHVGAMNPAEAYRLAKAGGSLGVSAVSSVIPFYYDYALDEIAGYYRRIQEASGLPLILYYLPGNTNKVISIEQFCNNLLTIPGVAGMKFTDSDLNKMQMAAALGPRPLAIFGGYDQMGVCFLAMGAQALIGSTFNMIPEMFTAMYRAFREGNIEKARRKQLRINRFVYEVKKFGNRAYFSVLKIRGMDIGIPRKPGRELSKTDWKKLEALVGGLQPELESD